MVKGIGRGTSSRATEVSSLRTRVRIFDFLVSYRHSILALGRDFPKPQLDLKLGTCSVEEHA